jgi:hypothetical protein
MVALIEKLTRDGGGAAVTREQARKVAAKPKPGRPKAFVFSYRAPAKTFSLKLQFKKSDVDKKEVIEALDGRTGISYRFSPTLQKRMLYVAVPVFEGGVVIGVVRVSVFMNDINTVQPFRDEFLLSLF